MHCTPVVQQTTYCNCSVHNICRNCLGVLQFLEISDYVIQSTVTPMSASKIFMLRLCKFLFRRWGHIQPNIYFDLFPKSGNRRVILYIKYAAGWQQQQQQLVFLNINKTNSLDKGQQNLDRGFPLIMPALQTEKFVSPHKMEEQRKFSGSLFLC